MEERYKNAFSEVYLIIENLHPKIKEKISIKFVEFLRKNKNDNYIPDPLKINLQNTDNLMKETKIVLAIMYEKNLKE